MRLGLCEGNKPYIVPLNFAYEVTPTHLMIYFHGASEGKKLDMIANNSNACFEADCCYKLLTAESACNWSAEFQSVIGEGTISIVTDEAQRIHALDVIMKRHGFEGKPSYKPSSFEAVTVLQICVTSITGKSKRSKRKL
jgi:nitroimidazol reductase NimA-like FMN-containing flavoprotein (pyridoxamine 5'-phosphate oxidase superfamily)